MTSEYCDPIFASQYTQIILHTFPPKRKGDTFVGTAQRYQNALPNREGVACSKNTYNVFFFLCLLFRPIININNKETPGMYNNKAKGHN